MARHVDWAALEEGILSLYRCPDSEAVLRQVEEAAGKALAATAVRVYLYDDEWRDLYVPAGPDTEPLRFPLGEGAAGVAAEGRTWYALNKPAEDPVFQPAVDLEAPCLLAVPAIDGADALVGVLELGLADKPADETIEAALQLGRHFGNAHVLCRARGEESMFSRGLALSYGTAIDSMQIGRSDHSQRVARYAQALGKAAGLVEGRLKVLEVAAFLHDVGKVFLAGRPSSDEPPPAYLHVILAEAFLGMIEPPEQYAELTRMVSEHHECWDGNGFPKGLAGEATLLESRVLAMANDFDCLQHGWLLPNRRATAQEAAEFMASQAGKRYDPNLVRIFLATNMQAMDLRAHARYRYSTPVEVENLTHPEMERFEGQAADISEGGLLIEAARGQDIGDLLRLFIYLPSGEPLEAIVRVVRSSARPDGRYDIGVHYIWHAAQT